MKAYLAHLSNTTIRYKIAAKLAIYIRIKHVRGGKTYRQGSINSVSKGN